MVYRPARLEEDHPTQIIGMVLQISPLVEDCVARDRRNAADNNLPTLAFGMTVDNRDGLAPPHD